MAENALNSAPSELTGEERHSLPPVAPEVINILLFQRSSRELYAPLEHFIIRRMAIDSVVRQIIIFSSFRADKCKTVILPPESNNLE
jgi:hypothetical protein